MGIKITGNNFNYEVLYSLRYKLFSCFQFMLKFCDECQHKNVAVVQILENPVSTQAVKQALATIRNHTTKNRTNAFTANQTTFFVERIATLVRENKVQVSIISHSYTCIKGFGIPLALNLSQPGPDLIDMRPLD